MAKEQTAPVEQSAVDSTLIVGDLTDLSQISRTGKVVTIHGREGPTIVTLPTERIAAYFWEALATEAASAVKEDRQFFCVSFGAADANEDTTH